MNLTFQCALNVLLCASFLQSELTTCGAAEPGPSDREKERQRAVEEYVKAKICIAHLETIASDYRQADKRVISEKLASFVVRKVESTKGLLEGKKPPANFTHTDQDVRRAEIPEKYGLLYLNNPHYYEDLVTAVKGLGYIESGIGNPGMVLVNMKKPLLNLADIQDAALVRAGEYADCFVLTNGDLVIPGLKFPADKSRWKTTGVYWVEQVAKFSSVSRNGPALLEICGALIAERHMPAGELAFVYYLRGDVYAQLGDDDRAMADLNESLKYDQSRAGVLVRRGGLHRKYGRPGEALKDYERALEIEKNLEKRTNIERLIKLLE